jgi:glycosyltransferase involved in cell wall biosynthesis
MAMGATVLTTRFGALPETLAGFGRMVEPRDDAAALATDFAAMAIDALNEIRRKPDEATERRRAQIAYVHENYTWPARALEWQSWLFDMIVQNP